MRHNIHTNWRQRGDTIVEVLISITVISLVLAGAYVTTNKSLQATRSAQERGNALKLAESQVEQIKGVLATNPSAIFSGPSPFCVYASGTTLNVVAASNSNCTIGAAGSAQYRLSVQRAGNDFTVYNSWDSVNGTTTDQLQLSYRAYQ